MPTDLEKELLALAAAERERRTGSLVTSKLYTATATAEKLREAIASEGMPASVTPVVTSPGLSENVAVRSEPENWLGMGRPPVEIPDISIEDLSQMFMGVEARAQLGLHNVMGLDLGADATDETVRFDIEFDQEVEGSTSPNEAVRFRVDRDNPPPVSMIRDLVPTGGRVVSVRGVDGRFRSASSATPAAVPRTQPEHHATTPQTTGSQNEVRLSALERLVGRGPFDDD